MSAFVVLTDICQMCALYTQTIVSVKDCFMNLSEKIKLLRQTEGLTQKKLSELAGIDVTSIQNYENGRRKPNTDFMETLCNAFPEYTLWLMTDDEKVSVTQINPVANGGVNIAGNNNGNITIDNSKKIINNQNNQNVEFITGDLQKQLFKLHQEIYNARKMRLGGYKNTKSANELHAFIWSRLNNYMGVSSYKQIKLSNYQEAENYFNDWVMRYKGRTPKSLKEKYEKLKQFRESEKNTYFELLDFMDKDYKTKFYTDLTEEEFTDVLVHFSVI